MKTIALLAATAALAAPFAYSPPPPPRPAIAPQVGLFLARIYVADSASGKVIAQYFGQRENHDEEETVRKYEPRAECENTLAASSPVIARRYSPETTILVPACIPRYFEG